MSIFRKFLVWVGLVAMSCAMSYYAYQIYKSRPVYYIGVVASFDAENDTEGKFIANAVQSYVDKFMDEKNIQDYRIALAVFDDKKKTAEENALEITKLPNL